MDKLENYVGVKLPKKETDLAWTFWGNIKGQEFDEITKFSFIFAYFYSLGKYNSEPIDKEIKKLIDEAIKKD